MPSGIPCARVSNYSSDKEGMRVLNHEDSREFIEFLREVEARGKDKGKPSQ